MRRSPGWSVDPTHSLGVFKAREGPPESVPGVVRLFIGQKLAAEERLAVCFAANRAGIQQEEAALLSGPCHELLSFEPKHHRSDATHIQILPRKPFTVGRGVRICELQVLRGKSEKGIRELAGSRIVNAIAGF